MPCSAVTLSIATITAIVAAALMAIAFSTDNWLYIEVKRTHIQVRISLIYYLIYCMILTILYLCLPYNFIYKYLHRIKYLKKKTKIYNSF